MHLLRAACHRRHCHEAEHLHRLQPAHADVPGAAPQRRATIAEIATAFGISRHHLTKVAHGLGRNGWLANVRGKGGGLALAMPPQHIVIGAVVRLSEGADLPAACFAQDGEGCAIASVCRLRGALAEAVLAFYAALDRYTLADLVHDPARAVAPAVHRAQPATGAGTSRPVAQRASTAVRSTKLLQ